MSVTQQQVLDALAKVMSPGGVALPDRTEENSCLMCAMSLSIDARASFMIC